jgi:type IV pilus assembly protein PilC
MFGLSKKEEDPKYWTTKPPRFLHISLKEKMFFAKYLAALLQSGIPLDKGLLAIHNQTKSRALHRILHVILTDVASGEFLTTSLKRFPRVFDQLFVSLVEVGEQSGTLTDSLSRIAQHLEKTRELRAKVRGALLYPLIVIAGTIGTAAYLVLVLLPQLLPLFTSLNIDLPITTRIVLAVSKFFLNSHVFILIALAISVVTFALLLRIQKFRYAVDWTLLRIPVIGALLGKIQMAQLSNITGTLLKSGITIIEALKITAGALSNHVYQAGLRSISNSVQEGESISSYLAKHTTLFPGFVTQMIAIGEETGKLDESFLFIAEFSEREVDDATKTLTTILEPALLILVGGFVGFIAIAIITPIYSLTRGIKP